MYRDIASAPRGEQERPDRQVSGWGVENVTDRCQGQNKSRHQAPGIRRRGRRLSSAAFRGFFTEAGRVRRGVVREGWVPEVARCCASLTTGNQRAAISWAENGKVRGLGGDSVPHLRCFENQSRGMEDESLSRGSRHRAHDERRVAAKSRGSKNRPIGVGGDIKVCKHDGPFLLEDQSFCFTSFNLRMSLWST